MKQRRPINIFKKEIQSESAFFINHSKRRDWYWLSWFLRYFGDFNSNKRVIEFKINPHFNTLHKFFTRFSANIFNRILAKTIRKLLQKGERIPVTLIDATGFTSAYASHYYSNRIGKTRKSFVKTSIAVDSKSLLIKGWKFSKYHVNDRRHAKLSMPTLKSPSVPV